MSSVSKKLIEILREELNAGDKQITEETDIAEELGADSMDVLMLMSDIETEWGLTIEEDDVLTFRTVGDVSKYISEHAL